MLHTLLGCDRFLRVIDIYFGRHAGQAVTCDEFVAAMEDANDQKLTLFRRWYSQAGTPVVTVTGKYDDLARAYEMTVSQETNPTPGQPEKEPLHTKSDERRVGKECFGTCRYRGCTYH